jgi:competence protein ComEC
MVGHMGAMLGVTGLILAVAAIVLAVAVKARWAKPAAAALLILALVGEAVAVQANTSGGSSAQPPAGLGGSVSVPPTTSPTPTTVTTLPVVNPSVIHPQLLDSVHPGSGPVTRSQQINREFVRIVNKATHSVTLTGWKLSNLAGQTFTFPTFVVLMGASVNIHTGSGSADPTNLYWGLSSFIWKTKDRVTLRNASGVVINLCAYTLFGTQKGANCAG